MSTSSPSLRRGRKAQRRPQRRGLTRANRPSSHNLPVLTKRLSSRIRRLTTTLLRQTSPLLPLEQIIQRRWFTYLSYNLFPPEAYFRPTSGSQLPSYLSCRLSLRIRKTCGIQLHTFYHTSQALIRWHSSTAHSWIRREGRSRDAIA